MITVARVFCDSPHAVQRDLLCHGFHFAGFGAADTRPLSFWQFVSFVLGAPPTTALGYAVSEGWTTTDHLLANLAEQHAGLIELSRRYPRPGLPDAEPAPEPERHQQRLTGAPSAATAIALGGQFDSFETIEEFQAKLEQHRALSKTSA